MGPRKHVPEDEQKQMAVTVVAEIRRLLAEGDRAGANAAILHGVHDGIDAVVMFEEIDKGRP
jgi:hypothetical protein